MKTSETIVPSPDERPAPKPQKQRGLWWVMKWSLAIIVPMIVVIVLLNFRMGPGKGKPLVRVSPQTTFATSPLKPGGDVDYVAFLNQQHAVTPENNAFVELLYIKGPMVSKKMPPPEFFQLLGIKPLPAMGDYFDEFPFTPKTAGVPLVTVGDAELNSEDVYLLTNEIPYPPGLFPVVDEWNAKHSHHFAAMRLAVRKPGYYVPYVADVMYVEEFAHSQGTRSIASGLQRSSLARLGQGDVGGAIDDQVAMMQLARHVGRQGMMVEHLTALAIEGIAQASIGQTIFSDKCTAEDLGRLAAELKAQSPMPPVGPLHLQSERVSALDAVIHVGRSGPIPWNGDFWNINFWNDPPPRTVGDELLRASIDWETVCVTLNEIFDKLEKAIVSDGASRAKAIEQFEAELRAIEQEFGTPKKKILSALVGRGGRSSLVGNILATMLMPAMQQIFEADIRVAAQLALNEVAVAIQRFRLEHGKYPRQLDELVPEFLEAVPLDPYSGEPLVYKPDQGDPFLLYSVGPNKSDDGGVGMFEVPYHQSDLIAAPIVRTVEDWIKKNKQTP